MSVEMAQHNASEIFIANVRREMAARNWTQTELARRCRLPQPRIAEILKGQFDHRLSTLERVANAFGTTAAALLVPPAEVAE